MDLHGNAALSWSGRRQLAGRVVDQGWTLRAAAEAAGVSVRCARRRVGRYREGDSDLFDRSSAPRRVANRTDPERITMIAKLRRLRMTAAEIAETLSMPLSTVSGILTRIGMGRLGRGLEPAVRYERSRPGELVHLDVKKLGRIVGGAGKRWRNNGYQHYTGSYTDAAGRVHAKAGWEYVHVAVDDYSRLAYAEVLPDEKAATAVGFLRRAVAFYRRYGIHVEAVLSDNGPAYISIKHALACRRSGSNISASDPTGRRQTGRRSALSARCSPAGPTPPSTAQAKNAPTPLTAGSGTTTINADTQPSATNRPSAEPTCRSLHLEA